MSQPPRKPGSQVAPGQKPLFTDGRTASTHSKIPLDQATAGKLYRVRDKDWAAVWGENLSHGDAVTLKNQVVGARKSTTARVEDMDVPPPDWYQPEQPVSDSDVADLAVESPEVAPAAPAPAALGVAFHLAGEDPQTIPSRGVVTAIPPGTELVIDGQVHSVPAPVSAGNVVVARALDPALAAARKAALLAARPVTSAAQSRANAARAYRDITVKAPAPRTQPPPRDKTIAKQPVTVRLGTPPSAPPTPPGSPLKAALETDGAPLPADALTDDQLPDLTGDLGGGPSEADLEHAKRQREQSSPAP